MNAFDGSAHRIREVLEAHQGELLEEWVDEVRAAHVGAGLSDKAIIDHLPLILNQISQLLGSPSLAQRAKLSELGEAHAVDRLAHGFELDQVVLEYAALRRVIVRMWQRVVSNELTVPEVSALDQALDESIRQAVVQYADTRERLLQGLNDVSEAAARAAELEPFLEALLDATVKSLPCVDTAVVLVREGDRLVVRAAYGLEEDLVSKFSLRIGEGFSGRVASLCQPLTVHDASNDPLIQIPISKTKNVLGLYGVPLVSRDEVVGVAHIGSLSAPDFAEENKLLFRTMASRAASYIAKARVIEKLRRAERVQSTVATVGRILMETLNIRQSLDKAAHAMVPVVADLCVIDLLNDKGLERVSTTHVVPAKGAIAVELGCRFMPDLNGSHPIAKAIRSGVVHWEASVSHGDVVAVARDDEHQRLLSSLGVKSYISIPLRSRERTLGCLTLALTESDRRYSEEDFVAVEEVAQRIALAIENSRLYAEAMRAVEIRDQLLAVVSHDLRNHLGVISAATGVIADDQGKGGAAARRSIPALQRASLGMSRLVSDLLDSSAIRVGRLSLDLHAVDLDTVVRHAVESHEAGAAAKGLTIKLEAGLPGAEVMGDAQRLDQVLGNILGNAVIHCRQGDQIVVHTRPAEKILVVEVQDTGPGIAPDLLAKLFDPYSRKEGRTPGTGLGLFIAKGIVERHGGTIECESTVGVGTLFRISLPRFA